MKFVDCPCAPFEQSMNVMPASSNIFLSTIGFFRYCSMLFGYGSMPWSPSAATLLIAHAMSCCRPQIELVVPKKMSGLIGSSGLCLIAPHTVDGPNTLAAAVSAPSEKADDMNSRLLAPRSVVVIYRAL